jgi:hypothetical protein
MTASISFYDAFKANMGAVPLDIKSDTYKLMLVTSTYTINTTTHAVKADVTNELATANGYTAGGITMTSPTYAQVAGVATWDAADTSVTASGGSLVFRRGVIYDDTSASDYLVLSILFDTTPADITVLSGNTFTVQWNASGIFTLT